jgi:hypothetical protein
MTWRVHMSQLGEACKIIAMPEFFCLKYVVKAHEDIQIVLGQFTKIPTDRVVDEIIHYRGCTLVAPEPPLKKMIVRAMCDPPSTGHFGYSYSYEAL